jgi:transcriptional regulator with XRE-family HTH domain
LETTLAKTIGNAARNARAALSLTQEDAAELIGISLEFYARIERGGTLPSVPTLARMAEALQTSTDALLGANVRDAGAPSWRAPPPPPADPPEVRRLLRRMRRADSKTLKLLNAFLSALERR